MTSPTIRVRVRAVEPHGTVAVGYGRDIDNHREVVFYGDHRMMLPIAEHIRHIEDDNELPVADVPTWSIA